MSDENEPREYSADEVKAQFLGHVNWLIQYWEMETRATTSLSKLEGLAFSIMTAIDGMAMGAGLPKFILAPDPTPNDRAYRRERGENFYFENYDTGIRCDISGNLHEILSQYKDT